MQEQTAAAGPPIIMSIAAQKVQLRMRQSWEKRLSSSIYASIWCINCNYTSITAIKKWQTLLPNVQNVNLRVGGIIVNISSIFLNKNIWQNQAFSFAFFRLFGCYTWCWTVSHPSRSLPYQSQPSSNPLMASLYLILHSYLMLRNGGSISCICIYIVRICFFFFFITRNSQAALFLIHRRHNSDIYVAANLECQLV